MAETYPRGRIVWHELLTTDTGAATAFYQRLVGWGAVPYAPDGSYSVWTFNGGQLGGLMLLPEDAKKMGAPPTWLMYVGVPNVDAAVKQATSLGATVRAPAADIPNIGRYAVLADPQGATFALFRSAGPEMGHDGPAKLGEFSWTELATTDGLKAWDFYHAMFGWNKTTSMDMGPGGVYQMFGRPGQELGGIYNMGPETQGPPQWLHYVRVPDVDAAAAMVPELGGKVVSAPMEVPGGDRIAKLQDPQGVQFAIHSVRAAAVPATPPKQPAVKAKPAAAAKPVAAAAKRPSPVKAAPTPKSAAAKPKPAPKKAAAKSKAKPKKAVAKARKAAPRKAKKVTAHKGGKKASSNTSRVAKKTRGALKRPNRRR